MLNKITYTQILNIFIREYPVFKGICSDWRPHTGKNSIIIYLENGETLKVRYNEEKDTIHFLDEYKDIIEAQERAIDFKVYKALDNLYEIKSLYGNSSIWDKSDNVAKAIEALKEVHEQGYTEYILKNDH